MIRGITFSEQTFRSEDFAHYMNFFLKDSCGITKGCEVTNGGTSVTIGKGYFFIHGRFLNVEDAEVVGSTQFSSGYNRIVYEIDLSKENTVSEFNQGCIKVLTTEALIQEDLDDGGTIYQFPLCNFRWNGSAISNFVQDISPIIITNCDFIANVSSNWSEDSTNGGYYQTITVQGIEEGDNPIADVLLGSDVDANKLYLESWIYVTRIATANNSITLYANQKRPETAFTLSMQVVR